jgi:hypothetical protein
MKRIYLFAGMIALIVSLTTCEGGGSGSAATIIGSWESAGFSIVGPPALSVTNYIVTLNANGTFVGSYQTSAPNTQSGTFSPTAPAPLSVITCTTLADSGPDVPPLPFTMYMKYDNLTSTSADFYFDMGAGYEGPFTLNKM